MTIEIVLFSFFMKQTLFRKEFPLMIFKILFRFQTKKNPEKNYENIVFLNKISIFHS